MLFSTIWLQLKKSKQFCNPSMLKGVLYVQNL